VKKLVSKFAFQMQPAPLHSGLAKLFEAKTDVKNMQVELTAKNKVGL
jgi:hypothetical protein